ncbi:macro domain-containing protein [Methanolapillus millepedarum]|uniref:Thoeris protein ThsA Macro domain-containing protein n=1 Tax=Methanolapillus millepedarum TaxID=3028296 RepID=A0AA96ZTR4_9EURY|nr:hypothetical protein MsAc7_04340 [Methanosarcinaceae archaeon Ac7]
MGEILKKKITYFDRQLRKNYSGYAFGIITLFGVGSLFLESWMQKIIGIMILLLVLTILYVIMWHCANTKKDIILKINNSEVEVKFGNIFDQFYFKTIPFNEYFDTLVDNQIISEKSLNGIFVNREDKNEIDDLISKDLRLKEHRMEYNDKRNTGKKQKYKLGSVVKYRDEYILTAFSKFDGNDRAYLYMLDYINFLMTFWNEIDIIYGGKSVSVPLFGSGITRFKEYCDISDQELIELLIWSFKISRIKFTYPSKISIIILPEKQDKINLYKLKEMFV